MKCKLLCGTGPPLPAHVLVPVLQPDSSEECCGEGLDGMNGRLKKGRGGGLDMATVVMGMMVVGNFLFVCFFCFFCMNLETFILFSAGL